MKKILVLIIALAVCNIASAVKQCCPKESDVLFEGSCSSNTFHDIPLNCADPGGSASFWVIGDIARDSCGNLIKKDAYCVTQHYIDETNLNVGTEPILLACYNATTQYSYNEVEGITLFISTIFLAATCGVYISMPQLRNLEGMCYVWVCLSMALGFLFNGIIRTDPTGLNARLCTCIGFLAHTWMMATILWINVVSFNTYRTIRNPSHRQKPGKCQDHIWYHVYAWGCTSIVTALTVAAQIIEGNHLHPGFGERSCTHCGYAGIMENLVFFHGPIAVLTAVNFVLFLLSLIGMWRSKLNFTHKFLQSIELFFVMGIYWVFEIVSFVDGRWIWEYGEPFTSFQGVILFFLLVVCNKRVIQAIKRK